MFNQYDDIVPVEELMAILFIGRNKAYELLKSGQIQSFKVGRAYRIPKACIQDYVLQKVKQKAND
ncbi:helix-turn-helix domain-containing protein [Paenibacillus doosanensis]|uniref:helix-turn-helix domain-containing protein n=1 Tax=Paenibacillus doosanensis TaxID=1229154 RepID=UPI002180563B|nr:helix-turn-helix domain-containing protein [Paenibacillus doosanensis]MCS7460203.1 helix-turn-helix domain-containing protein [Paenibacillus doosanensis]